MDKDKFPENSIIYINQGYLTVKDNKRMFYDNYYTLGQIIEAINPPENIENYFCKDCKVKLYHPRYDPQTGQFLGLYESIGYLIVKGDDEEPFLNDGFCKENSKILYYYHKRRIPSSFCGIFFNRQRLQLETGNLQTVFLNVYYFLSSTTDRSKEINRHMNSANFPPIDIQENLLKLNVLFDHPKLDIYCPEKKKNDRDYC